MRATIDALTELQHVDDEIRGHQLQRDELAANLNRLQAILDRMNEELTEKQDKLAEATHFYTEKQADLRGDGDRLAKAKVKLANVTRTKEYAAMQRELDNLRRKYTDDEQELKRLAGAIDEYNSSISVQGAKLSELQEEVTREENSSAGRLGQLDGEIDRIAERKNVIRERLEAEPDSSALYNRYQRILERREGRAVVAAFQGKCTGCQMRLPPQQFIMVQRGNTLEVCSNCQRFLSFVSPEEAEVVSAESS